MKTLKKLMAVSLTAALLMSLFVTAFATSITINEPSEYAALHHYDVYQIYTGDLNPSDGSLSNVKYGINYGNPGSSVPKTELDAIGSGDAAARAFANKLMASDGALLNDVDHPYKTLNSTNSFESGDVTPGYYLIVDRSANPLSDGDILSQYIVQVLDDVTMSPKKDLVSSEKKITSDDHPKTEDGDVNPGVRSDGKVDNVSIGDTVNFTITNKVPLNASTYDYFYFIINDTLSPGLTLTPSDGNGIVVTANSDGKLTANTDYKVYTGDDAEGNTFQVAMTNAKAFAGQTITVTYSAVLNKDAVIGSDGNLNTESLTYSNNPNEKYDGTVDDNNPGKPLDKDKVPLGETPEETTQTFSSGIKIQKLDQDMMALAGAAFSITGESLNQVVKNVETFEQSATGTYYKLTSGAYTTEAPIEQDQMIEQASPAGQGYVQDAAGDVVVGGVHYRVVNDGEAGTHVLLKANNTLYESTTVKYAKTTQEVLETMPNDVDQKMFVNSDGTLELSGLGAGTYTIKETEVPDGYTAAKDLTLVITFNNETKQFSATVSDGTKTTSLTADSTTNLFPVDIQNIAGNVLPETGGIGTKIFYALGAVLVIGAGVVLVSRKRALD